jgi:5-methyltetrahydrofolate--homocysteine methyltransferase
MKDVVPFINWTYFFRAWRLIDDYRNITALTCNCKACKEAWIKKFPPERQEQAREAMKLFLDAQRLINRWIFTEKIGIKAIIYLVPTHTSEDDCLIVDLPSGSVKIPFLRQQESNSNHLSLVDFVRPDNDYTCLFGLTAGLGLDKIDFNEDTYQKLLAQSVCDRLAEASSEWLHYQVRTHYWGYSNESLDLKRILAEKYDGIRPAVGYSVMPDQSILFRFNEILNLSEIGISLTENAAMHPTSSICGLMIANPNAHYFMINKIGTDQLEDYTKRKNSTTEIEKKWLSQVL